MSVPIIRFHRRHRDMFRSNKSNEKRQNHDKKNCDNDKDISQTRNIKLIKEQHESHQKIVLLRYNFLIF